MYLQQEIEENGLHQVYIQYCYKPSLRTILSTGIEIPAMSWNKKFGRVADNLPAEFGTSIKLNKKLREMINVVQDLIDQALGNQLNRLSS